MDIKKIIKEQDVQFIQLQFVDINGIVKNLTIPSEHIDKILENDMMLDGSSIVTRKESITNCHTSIWQFSSFSLPQWLSAHNPSTLPCGSLY